LSRVGHRSSFGLRVRCNLPGSSPRNRTPRFPRLMARPPEAASESRGNPAVARFVLRALWPRHAGPGEGGRDGHTLIPTPDSRGARRAPTRTTRATSPRNRDPLDERRLAAVAPHALALPPLLAPKHTPDRVPVPA